MENIDNIEAVRDAKAKIFIASEQVRYHKQMAKQARKAQYKAECELIKVYHKLLNGAKVS